MHPRLVPQMAGAEEVVAALPAAAERDVVGPGAERARPRSRARDRPARGARRVPGHATASRARNQNTTPEAAAEETAAIIAAAQAAGVRADGDAVVLLRLPVRRRGRSGPGADARRAAARPPGRTRSCSPTPSASARPRQVRAAGRRTRSPPRRPSRSACTCTTPATPAMPTPTPALEAGATLLDASIGGLGGCPFAPRATGNIATEDLVYLLDGLGVEHGCDLDELIARQRVAGGRARPRAARPAAPRGPLPRLKRHPVYDGRAMASDAKQVYARGADGGRAGARCCRPDPVRGPLPRPAPRPAPADRAAAQRRERPRSTPRTRSCATC